MSLIKHIITKVKRRTPKTMQQVEPVPEPQVVRDTLRLLPHIRILVFAVFVRILEPLQESC